MKLHFPNSNKIFYFVGGGVFNINTKNVQDKFSTLQLIHYILFFSIGQCQLLVYVRMLVRGFEQTTSPPPPSNP